MAVHPTADLFPMFEHEALEELAEDIRTNGLNNPIVVDLDGVLLDGRNRVEACDRAGVKPQTVVYDGDDPVGFIVSQNIRRRHLSTSQRALLALEVLPHYEAQAAKRMQKGWSDTLSSNEDRVPDRKRPATEDAGDAVGVSAVSVQRAKRIAKEAPELVDDIKKGKTTVGAAVKTLPPKSKPGPRKAINKQRDRFGTAWGSLTGSLEVCQHIELPDDLTTDEAKKCAIELGKLLKHPRALRKTLEEYNQ